MNIATTVDTADTGEQTRFGSGAYLLSPASSVVES